MRYGETTLPDERRNPVDTGAVAMISGSRMALSRLARGRHPGLLLGLSLVAVMLAIIAGAATGGEGIGVGEVLHALHLRLFGGVLENDFQRIYTVLWELRLPRVMLALVGGAALSVSGVLMQGLLRNPLVSPFTLGVSPAAAFGAALAMMAGGFAASAPWLPILSALAFALGCAALIVGLATLRAMSPAVLILLGIALTQLFTALTSALQYVADEKTLAAIVRWTFGSVNAASWSQVAIIAAVLAASLPYLLWRAKELNAIAFAGDDAARSLGVNVGALRVAMIAISVLLAAVVVAFTGVIGFVGLVGPHIARLMIGADHRYLLPFSGISGGLLLILSDLLGRTLLAPVVIPVGIVVAFIGVPIFVNLILRNRQVAG